MSRLTTKNNQYDGYIVVDDNTTVAEVVQKIGEYEDLEEELGCPFEVIEKAIKNGIYTNVYSGICYVTRSDDFLLVSDDYAVRLSDYKKTWWLKEDKTE